MYNIARVLADRKIKSLFDKIIICSAIFTLLSAGFIIFGVKNSAVCVMICFLLMCAVIIAFCFSFFCEQHKIMENAVSDISKYMSDGGDINIEQDEEGELYKLFHEVNLLVAALNAHAENEKSSKEFLKNIISDISHQLKTPLAALNIYNGIIREEAGDIPDVVKFSALSERELDRLEALVQNLLKIAKLDAGMIVPEKSDVNLYELAEDIREHFIFRAKSEDKDIVLSGSKDITFFCDRSWMTEAVGNLVKNALDHTGKNGVIHIEWSASASMVRITVKDNGSGIHPEDIYYIFKRFYRSRFSKDTQGLGLGLPLTKAIAEAHNGTVEADSVLGVGTSFSMNFLITTKL